MSMIVNREQFSTLLRFAEHTEEAVNFHASVFNDSQVKRYAAW